MLVKKISAVPSFLAGDHTRISELLHPDNDGILLAYSLAHASLEAGQASLPHELTGSEVYILLSGSGQMYIDGESRGVKEGEVIYIPPGASQYIENTGPGRLQFLCIVAPPWSAESERIH